MTAVRASRPDSGSVADFYATTVERTFATARRVAGDRDTAWDATQDAYVVMVHRWGERCTRSVRDNQRYVIGIAVRKVVDWYRRQGRLVRLDDEEDPVVQEAGYGEVLDRLTAFREVRRLLECQSPGLRAVGILYFLEGFEYAEIADVRGVTTSTVRSQVQFLRARLEPLVNRITEAGDQP